jgi:ergothioneine biosynthesis protein EgtB
MSTQVGVRRTQDLLQRFEMVRTHSLDLCDTLEVEDFVVQSMTEASPVKWNLAHTTWFFEAFILQPFQDDYQPVHPQYAELFNSYYWAQGERWPRHERGLLTRPTVQQVMEYRQRIDDRLATFLAQVGDESRNEVLRRLEIGIQHEQQHQELLLMDLKHALSLNPLLPVYREPSNTAPRPAPALRWIDFGAGLQRIGTSGTTFHYDNESPAHAVHVPAFQLANRCVTNGEWMEWMDAGGYDDPTHWMMDGWAHASREGWKAPLYWEKHDGAWHHFTLGGLQPVDEQAPVMHVSWFEADAMARWKGLDLPTEEQWEVAAADADLSGNYVESGELRPLAPLAGAGLLQMGGDVWEHTASAYRPYPGFRAESGALGEYNGKFMSGQMVLRGGSCITPESHLRRTYRNFFYPQARWVFAGVRLARPVG